MSNLWKIILGIVVAVLILGAVGSAAFIAGQWSVRRSLVQRPRPSIDAPAGQAGQDRAGRPQPGDANSNLRPDRDAPFNRDFRPDQRRPFGLFFTPFLLIGGLVRGLIALAFLALLISLTIYLYRRWQPTTRLVAAPVAVAPASAEVESAPADIQPEDQTPHEG